MNSPQPVTDKPTEKSIKINNVLITLLLSTVLWVADTVGDIKTDVATAIDDIKESVAEVSMHQMVNTERVNGLVGRIERLENDSTCSYAKKAVFIEDKKKPP